MFNHPSVTVLAYLDDVFLIGSLEEALASLDDLKSSFSSVGLKVAEGKCEVFCPSNESAQEASKVTCIPTASMGTKILGLSYR